MNQDPNVRLSFLRNKLAQRALEMSELNAAIGLSAPLAQKRQAINHYADLVAQTHKLTSELESLQAPGFRRRLNAYGGFDSICLQCYATAARGDCESDLKPGEYQHICESGPVQRYSRTVRQSTTRRPS